MRQQLIDWYLDWVSNYLSVDKFAEHNGLSRDQALKLLELGEELHNTPHPES